MISSFEVASGTEEASVSAVTSPNNGQRKKRKTGQDKRELGGRGVVGRKVGNSNEIPLA